MGNLDRFNAARSRSNAAHAAGGVFVDASELNALALDFGLAGEAAGEKVAVAVQVSLAQIEAEGKQFAAVDTGFMRSSIGRDTDPDGLGGEVGPTASYAPFVENGTSEHAPQAFMGPAFDRAVPDFVKAVEQAGVDAEP